MSLGRQEGTVLLALYLGDRVDADGVADNTGRRSCERHSYYRRIVWKGQ
jgi:hypothetical protein